MPGSQEVRGFESLRLHSKMKVRAGARKRVPAHLSSAVGQATSGPLARTRLCIRTVGIPPWPVMGGNGSTKKRARVGCRPDNPEGRRRRSDSRCRFELVGQVGRSPVAWIGKAATDQGIVRMSLGPTRTSAVRTTDNNRALLLGTDPRTPPWLS
jgi:hypothetical protein